MDIDGPVVSHWVWQQQAQHCMRQVKDDTQVISLTSHGVTVYHSTCVSFHKLCFCCLFCARKGVEGLYPYARWGVGGTLVIFMTLYYWMDLGKFIIMSSEFHCCIIWYPCVVVTHWILSSFIKNKNSPISTEIQFCLLAYWQVCSLIYTYYPKGCFNQLLKYYSHATVFIPALTQP